MAREATVAGPSRLAIASRRLRYFWLTCLVVGALAVVAFFSPTPPEALSHPDRGLSLQLVDRNGELLRDVLSTRAGVAHWRSLDDISPYLASATVVSEDRRFYHHPGIDPLAIGRAFQANWRQGKVVQGGSTITQQLVRNLLFQERNWQGKLNEAYWALRVDRIYSKNQILEFYLNRVAYGSQCYGVEAASQFYFAKNAGQLSCAQAAFLALLPRAPESFQPYQELEEMLPLQQQLLRRMREAGTITQEELDLAVGEKLRLHAGPSYYEAGHFCDFVQASQQQSSGVLRTTLDVGLNREIEAILRTQIKRIHSNAVNNGAVVVLDVFSGDVVAMVGSKNYEESQFNAATAGRQPGSALKPFTYALALERDKTAASILPDLNLYPRQIANGYIPRNYDDKFHGPTRLRTALACSYNVPVVRVLEEIGTESLLSLLRNLGFSRLTDTPQHYGLGLTLGDGEVTLLELANAYRTLARGGRLRPVRFLAEQQVDAERPVIDPRAAWIITDILKDRLERVPAFGSYTPLNLPFQVAAKTGTSKSYRDNWTVGYTPRYVVAVWVGNLDGSSMKGVSGITGAGPIFHECFLAVERRLGSSPNFTPPVGVEQVAVCPASGVLAGKDCPGTILEWFCSDKKPTATCSVHQRRGFKVYLVYPPLYRNWMAEQGMPIPRETAHSGSNSAVSIAFPDGNSIFRRDPVVRADHQEIHFRGVVPDDTASVDWTIDRVAMKVSISPFALWWRLQPGAHQAVLVAHDARQRELGRSRPVSFIVR